MVGSQAVFVILGGLAQEKEEVRQPQDEQLIGGFWTHKHSPAFGLLRCHSCKVSCFLG